MMRDPLLSVALRGLRGRRRDSAMMLCVLAAVFALMTAMLCYNASGGRAAEENRKSIYGEWQIARYSLSEAEAAAFVQQTAPAAVGRAEQYAQLVTEQGLAFGALGTADAGYLACGRLEPLSGRLPAAAGEAAMTTSVLDSLGASYELGQTVTLRAQNGGEGPTTLQYTLCGVLPSYDAYWAVDRNLPVDVLLAQADGLPASWQPTVQLLCCYDGAVPLVPYQDGAQDPTWVKNIYAYPEQSTGTGLAAFVAGCAFLALCAVFGLCSGQLRRREEGLVTLRMIGASKRAVLRLCLWEAALLLAGSLPLGVALGLLLCLAGLLVQGSAAWLTLPLPQLGAALAVGALAVTVGLLLPAARQAGQRRTRLPQKKVRRQRRLRLLSPLPLRILVLNAAGLVLALCCVFFATWELLPYRRQAAQAAINIDSVRVALTEGLVQDLSRLPDVQQAAARTELPYLCGLSSEAFARQNYWELALNQRPGVYAFRMSAEDRMETRVYALPEQALRELAALCTAEVDMEALLSGQSALLLSAGFALDEQGVTQWNGDTPDFTGQQMTLHYPTLDGADAARSLVIGGCFGALPKDMLAFNGALTPYYSLFCSEALGRQLWAEEVGTPYGYTTVNVRLRADASYATRRSIAALATRRGGVLRSDGYEKAARLWQEGSAAAFLSVVAGVLSAALAAFLLWNLFQLYWQQQRRRVGVLQAGGAARRQFWRGGLRQGACAAAGALVLGNAAVAALWLCTTAQLATYHGNGIYEFSTPPMRGADYPWLLHAAVCAGYLGLILGLQLLPLLRIARCSPVQNLREGA